MINGIFRFGFSTYTIITDNERAADEKFSWMVDYSEQNIILRTVIDEVTIENDTVIEALFTAWVDTFINEFFIEPRKEFQIVGKLLHQAWKTLKFDSITATGSFDLMGDKWTIVEKTKELRKQGCLGDCNYTLKRIRLALNNKEVPIHSEYLSKVLYHEMIHAVLANAEINDLFKDESFVNMMAIFFKQFIRTLKIDKYEEE